MPFSDFIAKPISGKIITVEYGDQGDTDTQYWSNIGYTSDDPSSDIGVVNFEPRVKQGLVFERNLYSEGKIGGATIPSFGEIVLDNMDGGLDSLKNDDGSNIPIRVRMAELGTVQYSNFTLVASVTGESLQVGRDQAIVRIRDLSYRMQTPIQDNLYRGMQSCLSFTALSDHRVEITFNPASELFRGWEGGSAGENFGNAGSIQFWALFNSTANENQTIFSWDDNDDTQLRSNILVNPSSGLITHVWLDGAGLETTLTATYGSAVWLDNWNHITISGSSVRLNGEAPVTLSSSTASRGAPTDITSNMRIGNAGGAGDDFNGLIDDVRIFNRRTTIDEETREYLREYSDATAIDGLIAYYDLNDNSGTTATDGTGHGNNGTLTGAVGVPAWVGSMTGGTDIVSTPIPLCYGQVNNAQGVLVYDSDLIFQFHDRGVLDITAVYDSGVVLTLDTAHTNIQSFLEDTVVAGQYNTFANFGLVMLGSTPDGMVTADVQGDDGGSNGYVNRYDSIVREIVTRHGQSPLTDPTDLDTASFTTTSTAQAGVVGVYIRSKANIDEVLNDLAASVGGFWGFTRAGLFQIGIFDIPTITTNATIEVTEDSLSVETLPTQLPAYRLRVGYQHNYTIQSGDQVAGSVSVSRRDFLEKAVREELREDKTVINPGYLDLGLQDPGFLQSQTVAANEADRQFFIYNRQAEMYRISEKIQHMDLDLNDVILLTWNRFSLDDGEEFRIVRMRETLGDEFIVELDLWAVDRTKWLVSSTSTTDLVTDHDGNTMIFK